MTDAEACERVRAILGGVTVRPLGDIYGVEDEQQALIAVAMVATRVLEPPEARRAYAAMEAARGETGLAAILVAEAGEGPPLWIDGGLPEELVAFERSAEEVPPPLDAAAATAVSAALDELGRRAGRDPLAVLHRVSLDDLAMLAAGDEPGEGWLDEDALLPDDVATAYAEQLAEQRRFLEAQRGGGPVLLAPLRAPDPAAAIERLAIGRARLVLVESTPALALLHLSFGGFNACPAPHEHARTWTRWAARWGALPVAVTTDRIHGTLARPPSTRDALVELAVEVARYDGDLLAEGWLCLAGALYRNARIDLWWD